MNRLVGAVLLTLAFGVFPVNLASSQETGTASLPGAIPAEAALDTVIQEGLAVTLEEARSLALTGNADLRSQRLSLDSARRSSQSRWNAFLPGISLNGGISNSHGITDGSASSWGWNASSGLTLSLTAGIPVQMRLAALGYELAQTNYQMQLQTVMASVASSFYNLVAEAQSLAILADNVELTRQQYEQARSDYNRGLASELEMLRSQYAYVSAGPQLERAKSQYQSNLAAFQILVGSQRPLVPAGDVLLRRLNLPSPEDLSRTHLEGRLDVIRGRQVLREAELGRTAAALSALAPSVSLSESFSMGPAGGRMDGEPSVSGRFSVSVSIPVDGFIPGSPENLSVKRAGDTVEAAQLSLETILSKAHQDIVAKASEVELLWNAIAVASLNESIAERAYQLSQEGWRAGLVSQTDLEDTRQQMVSAQLAAGTSRSQYLVGVGSLADALGLTVEQVYELYGVNEDE